MMKDDAGTLLMQLRPQTGLRLGKVQPAREKMVENDGIQDEKGRHALVTCHFASKAVGERWMETAVTTFS